MFRRKQDDDVLSHRTRERVARRMMKWKFFSFDEESVKTDKTEKTSNVSKDRSDVGSVVVDEDKNKKPAEKKQQKRRFFLPTIPSMNDQDVEKEEEEEEEEEPADDVDLIMQRHARLEKLHSLLSAESEDDVDDDTNEVEDEENGGAARKMAIHKVISGEEDGKEVVKDNSEDHDDLELEQQPVLSTIAEDCAEQEDEVPAVQDEIEALRQQHDDDDDDDEDHDGYYDDDNNYHYYNFWQRQAIRIARYPKTHFWIAFLLTSVLGIIGMTLTELNAADHTGWHARGTVIANRHAQLLMIRRHATELLLSSSSANDGGSSGSSLWEDLIHNVQPGWEQDNSVAGGSSGKKDYRRRRRRSLVAKEDRAINDPLFHLEMQQPLVDVGRQLQDKEQDTAAVTTISLSEKLSACNVSWYSDGTMVNSARLWPVWKVKDPKTSFLNPNILRDLCISETNTQRFLEERNLCNGCSAPNQCLPPYSLVLFARLTITGGFDMTCHELAEEWERGNYDYQVRENFRQCVTDLKATDDNSALENGQFPESCPFGFNPSFVDEFMDASSSSSSLVQYTSSIFFTTTESIPDLYRLVNGFDKGRGGSIQGAYDTQYQDFVNLLAEEAVGTDMILATASAIITTLAMFVHTRSLFLTVAGLLQICLSFPLAFFVYTYILGLAFFPFLNFIGVFVVFALGADDVFVAVDKWKNYRNQHPNATTEQVAAAALPDAAHAMLLTTSTTSVAFFGTAICPVAPIRVFAIFSGLLIFLDYIMVLVILFPCLCIYDRHNNSKQQHRARQVEENPYSMKSAIASKQSSTSEQDEESCRDGGEGNGKTAAGVEVGQEGRKPSTQDCRANHAEEEDSQALYPDKLHKKDRPKSLIQRILLGYYKFIDSIRWPLLAACLAAFVVSTYYAVQIAPPQNSEVRVLKPTVEYEDSYAWRMKLLSTAVVRKGGSKAHVIWGVQPADTGDQNDPKSWTQLVLDDRFDPSSMEAQTYMSRFCSAFFKEDFAKEPEPGYTCPINRFEEWLQRESNQTVSNSTVWTNICNRASGLPMDPDAFHPCLSTWARIEEETSILSYKGKVQVIYFPFTSRVRYDSTNDELRDEWNLIDQEMKWMLADAPAEVSQAFFSSPDFWYYDTTNQMYNTAYGSIAIALTAAALVILVSSKSLIMTIYSVVSVAYVLMSVISMTLAVGWTLGFLESICFAIAIGISVDFVIHFSHAYTTPTGLVSREERTKFALTSMGPSILAAAFTTVAGATIMFFTTIEFFAMFALVLFFTMIQATLGSFVFFLTLTNCVGPSQPTYFVDMIAAQCDSMEEEE